MCKCIYNIYPSSSTQLRFSRICAGRKQPLTIKMTSLLPCLLNITADFITQLLLAGFSVKLKMPRKDKKKVDD